MPPNAVGCVDWPHHDASRRVAAGGMCWHVQRLGAGAPLVLVHGTGASTHSWRDLAPRLAPHFTVWMLDLPGHGFSDPAPAGQATLPGMARLLAALLDALQLPPALAVGHSAGAAVLARLALDQPDRLQAIVSLNGAFVPFSGLMRLLSPAAKLLAATRLVPRWVSARARDDAAVGRLIASTGSKLDAAGSALYARLMRDPDHVAGALAMMANWDLDALYADVPRLTVPLLLVTGSRDRTVPPQQAAQVARRVRGAEQLGLPGLGHLAHEEAPAACVDVILRYDRAIVNGRSPAGGRAAGFGAA